MKSSLIILALVLASLARGLAVDPPATQLASQPARTLKFEVAPEAKAIAWEGASVSEQIIRPAYAAVIAFTPEASRSNLSYAKVWVDAEGSDLPGMSRRQRAFIRQQVYVVTFVWQPQQPVTVTFFAVTQEDAEQMARLFVEHIDSLSQHNGEYVRRELQWAVEMLKTAPPRVQEYLAQGKQLTEQMAGPAYKALGTDPAKWSRTVDEGRANLHALDIERAGQLARLRKIQEYMAQQSQPGASGQAVQSPASQPNPAVLTALETMLIELNIEMVGTQAKRDLLEKDIAPWQELLDLHRKRKAAEDAANEWARKLENAKRDVKELPSTLANPPDYMRPVQVKNNTVQIVPVRAPAATQPAGAARD